MRCPNLTMEVAILAALAVLAVVLAIRRRRVVRGIPRNSRTSRRASVTGPEPLIRQNHQDWKDAVYNPKEHRRTPCD